MSDFSDAKPFAKIGEFGQARPKLTALLLGLVTACGYPPLHGWWIAIPALALAALHWYHAPTWRAALGRGYLFGWAHLTLANNWIATAFTHQAKMPEFLGWLAVPLLCIYLAVYPAMAVLAAHWIARRRGVLAFGAVLAGAWILTEWLRGWAFTGYPWPPLGLVLLGGWDSAGLARLLPWLGTYALSGLTVLISALIAALVLKELPRLLMVVSAIVLAAAFGAMFWTPLSQKPSDTDIRYALIQPLITQAEINDGSKFEEQFQRITDLTAPGRGDERLVLWPESAIPDYLEDGYPQRYYSRMTAGADPEFARRRIAAVIGDKSALLTGVVNLDIGVTTAGFPGAVSARNSVLALGGKGDITHHYAKAHLVPYGEYLPLQWALEPLGLARLGAGTIEYAPGPGPRTLDLERFGKAGIQICYEIVFSGHVADRNDRPDYIFNPSNDGWFGTWGPPQHLAQARMRAIEEGLPVLRSTTTGISAVIDADGAVRGTVPLGEAGRIDGFIPEVKPPTLFALYGHALTLGWAVFFILVGFGLPRLLALRHPRS